VSEIDMPINFKSAAPESICSPQTGIQEFNYRQVVRASFTLLNFGEIL
jgi:hypothetical protein